MADDGFNLSTISFAGADLTPLRSISYTESGAKADVTGSSDTLKTYEGGVADISVSVTIVGSTSINKNDKGAIVVAWNDGTSGGGITNAQVDSVETSGSMDGEMLSTLVFHPSSA